MVQSVEFLQIEYTNLSELNSVAKQLLEFAGPFKIWAFEGQMGAGKTTLIKEICKCLRVEENVSSPTFSIVNEYHASTKEVIYHFDFYRLKEEEEALDIGVEEYFDSGNYCFLEWPSKIESLLPTSILKITISLQNNKRIIDLVKAPVA